MKAYKVLFVEDEKIDQKAFIRFVEKYSVPFEVTLAGSVAEAGVALDSNTFDAVIVDYLLGDGTAFDIIPRVIDIPVILFTGQGDEEVAVRAMKAGVHDYLIKDDKGSFFKILPLTVETAIRKFKEERLFKMLSHAIRDISDSVYFTSMDDRIIYVHEAFCRSYGYEENEILGQESSVLWKIGSSDEYREKILPRARRGSLKGEFQHKRADGTAFPVLLTQTLIRDGRTNAMAVVGIIRDITDRKLIEQQFQSLAHYDTLTSLPNRAYMLERINQAIIQARWNNDSMAFLFLDLDRFKNINDTLGHDAGDRMLKEVSIRLIECVRDSDTVARMGGDEFTVILPKIARAEDASIIAQRIIESLSKPFHLDGYDCSIGVSIGISQFPADGDTADALVRNADLAMYKSKELGRNSYKFFNSAMNIIAFDRMIMENKLRKALENEEFLLHYQPQIDLASGTIVGLEALARWKDPEGELLTSKDFIPLAEEAGFILPLGAWLIKQACRDLKAWHDAGHKDLVVSVNMSNHQLKQKNIAEVIAKELRNFDLSPRFLELELTENVLLNSEVSHATLRELDTIGLRLSIDDFGTGFASLNHLKRLPLGKLKIDQSFIHGIGRNQSDGEIVKAIVQIAHCLNKKVIAEGVESQEQLDHLRQLGCDEAQGFYFCQPMPPEEITDLLSRVGRERRLVPLGLTPDSS